MSSDVHCCTRRVRAAAHSWQTHTKTTTTAATAQQPRTRHLLRINDPSQLPAANSPRDAMRNSLLFALFGPSDAFEQRVRAAASADQLAEAHGWQLPQLARREGGLWLLSAAAIRSLWDTASRSGRESALRAEYHESPLARFYTGGGSSACSAADGTFAGDVLCRDCSLPTMSLGHGEQGGPTSSPTQLPGEAAQLLRQGMACVFRHAGLFPPGVERWGGAEFLGSQLKLRCHTLVSPANRKRFKYWRDESDLRTADRVPGGYEFTPPVRAEHLAIHDFLVRSREATHKECVYLQQTLLTPDPQGSGRLVPAGPIGELMAADLTGGLNAQLLGQIVQAGSFGQPSRCQLFVGADAAAHARTVLHFDQYDNIFMQLSGEKTFLLFDPLQSGKICPYPIHHPLDRSAQLDLEETVAAQHAKGYTRLGDAKGCLVTLKAGDVLVLPAYWWHEVITEPRSAKLKAADPNGDDAMTVSLNLWFTPMHRMLQPELPLSPMLRVELARQLEFLICDALDDRPELVPRFCAALIAFTTGSAALSEQDGAGGTLDPEQLAARLWESAQASTPSGVSSESWLGLLEYVAIKLAHILGGWQAASFSEDMLSAERFARLEGTRTRPAGAAAMR
jgi:hypoxia-inducible factor 1-alpha inhibitor (HIF hydroxylase)